ncbi:hypothetical protein A2716_03710 [candidate division WWE3 bacterium RIFCSPHIGHO2_01_FULL_40_23]|nr:MAG: hypothetical protein A2716_03710 [candidate division WWE3 bacterium RIFCSPHIGHO2_01_FULL_40_23]
MLLKNKVFIYSIVFAFVYFITHVPRLGNDEMNPDALNWHFRSEQYIDAIKSRDFRRTYQHYHPGVTLMLITGAPVEILKRLSNPRVGYDRFSYEAFHFVAKYTLNVSLLILTLILVFLLSKIFTLETSFLAGFFLTVEPFFLGNARLLHMDALLSLLLINGLVSYYLWYKKNSYGWLILSSLFIGFSFWTKNISILAIFFLTSFSFLLYIFKKITLKKFLIVLFSYVFFFFFSGYLILPALWDDPVRVFKKIYSGSKLVVEKGHEEKFFGVVTENPGPFYYPIVFLYKLSPLLLLSSLGILVYLFRAVILKKKPPLLLAPGILYFLSLFFLFYFLAVEIADKKIDRYLLPLYPIIIISVSYFLISFFSNVKRKPVKTALTLLLVVINIIPLVQYFPYYFVYNSPLFGGPRVADRVIGQKSFGIGIFEVRDFIRKNYGFVRVGFVDRKAMSTIYPNSMVFDARVYGAHNYDILVLDSDEIAPDKTKGKFVYDKTIKIAGINFWNFYVKKGE